MLHLLKGGRGARTYKAPQILRLKDVMQRVGLSRSTIYSKVKAGTFPKQKRLGPQSVGWLESDIDAFIENLPPGGRKR